MRLPPQVSAVVRRTMERAARGDGYRGIQASRTTESINCPSGQVVCACNSSQCACCPSNQCHVDSSTNLCVCGMGVPR